MGDGLRVILAPLLAMLNNLVVAAVRVAQAIAAIFGKKLTTNATNLSTGFEDVGSSIDDATGSAKKFKAQLASFDELDILKEDEDSGSGGLAGLGSGGFDVGDLYDVEDAPAIDGIKLLNEKLEEWNQKLKENYDKMVKAANDWGKQFSDAFLRIRWDLIGEVLANGLDIINGSINAFIDALDLDAFGRKFAEMFNHFFTELNWEELGKTWGNKLKILADVLYGFFDDLDWGRIATSIETAFRSMFDRIPWEKLGLTFSSGLNGITTIIMEWSDNFPIREFANKVWLTIKTAFENVDWKALGQSINKLLIQAFDALQDIDYSEITSKIRDFLKGLNLGQIIKEAFEAIVDIKSDVFGGLFNISPEALKPLMGLETIFMGVAKGIIALANSPLGTLNTQMLLAQNVLKGTSSHLAGILNPLGKFVAKSDGLKKAGQNFGFIKDNLSALGSDLKNAFTGKMSILEVISDFFTVTLPDSFKWGFEGIKKVFLTFKDWLIGFVKSNWVAIIIATVVATLTDLYLHNEEFRAKVQQAWEGIKEIISSAWNGVIKPIFDLAISFIRDVLAPVISWLYENVVKPVVEFIATTILDFWNNILQPAVQWVIDLLGQLIEFLQAVFQHDVQGVSDAIIGIVTGFQETFNSIIQGIHDFFVDIWERIKAFFEPLVTSLKDAGVDAFNLLDSGIGSALDGIKDAFSSAWSFIVGDTTDKFSTLVSKVGDAVSKIGSSVSSMLSTIANGISSAWSSINSFVSSAISRLASVVIPHFANGGVLDRPTVGLMGEYAGARTNPEIVTPESKMREVFNESNGEIAALLDRQNKILAEILEKDNSITIGDDVISASAARGNLAYKKRTGRSQFAI